MKTVCTDGDPCYEHHPYMPYGSTVRQLKEEIHVFQTTHAGITRKSTSMPDADMILGEHLIEGPGNTLDPQRHEGNVGTLLYPTNNDLE